MLLIKSEANLVIIRIVIRVKIIAVIRKDFGKKANGVKFGEDILLSRCLYVKFFLYLLNSGFVIFIYLISHYFKIFPYPFDFSHYLIHFPIKLVFSRKMTDLLLYCCPNKFLNFVDIFLG